MPLDMATVTDALRPELSSQLAPAEILDVAVTEGTDHDGSPILQLLVTFKAENDRLEPQRVLGLIRHLRRALAEMGETRFPHVRFQTETEAQEEVDEAN